MVKVGKKKHSWSICRIWYFSLCEEAVIFFPCSPPYHSIPPSFCLAPNWLYQNHVPAKVWCTGCSNPACVSAVTSAQFDCLQFEMAETASTFRQLERSGLAFVSGYTPVVWWDVSWCVFLSQNFYTTSCAKSVIMFIPNLKFLAFLLFHVFLCTQQISQVSHHQARPNWFHSQPLKSETVILADYV